MEYNECITIVQENRYKGVKKYNVTMSDGTKKTMRLFIGVGGVLAEFYPRSSRKGCCVRDYYAWKSLEPVPATCKSKVDIIRNNLKKIITYTDASGLWTDINQACKILTEQSNETLEKFAGCDYKTYNDLCVSLNIPYIGCDTASMLGDNKLIKTVNFESWSRETDKSLLRQAIKNNVEGVAEDIYRLWWRKGYDNSIEVNGKRAWYSEEYRNCGNGHYYLLLDESHAMFCEDD